MIRPPSAVRFLLFLLIPVFVPLWVIFVAVGWPPFGPLPPLAATLTIAQLCVLLAVIYSVARRRLRRKLKQELAGMYPHRPLHDAGQNSLTVHWARVEPIVNEVLRLPADGWSAYVNTKCPDVRLQRIVRETLVNLVGMVGMAHFVDPSAKRDLEQAETA